MEPKPDETNVEINGLEIKVKGVIVPNDPNTPEYWDFWRAVTELSQDG